MMYKGNLRKMSGILNQNNEVEYYLQLEDNKVSLNELIGKEIEIKYTGIINCVSCGKITSKSFAQGFCFSCMQSAPEADDCVLRPLQCKAHLGIARDMDWAKGHCLQPHYVYLANTGEVKVGVTRESQIPTRWIDQGASAAIRICKTPNRHIAGLIEAFLSKDFSDKTQWKKMVMDEVNREVNLIDLQQVAISLLPEELAGYQFSDDGIHYLKYPVNRFPQNPKTINLEHQNLISGILTGIKGQYLFFDDDRVINIRQHTGYLVELKVQ